MPRQQPSHDPPTGQTAEVHLAFATEAELEEARGRAAPGEDAVLAAFLAQFERGHPGLRERLSELEEPLIRWLESRPDAALVFALDPLDALSQLEPAIDPELLEAVEDVLGESRRDRRLGDEIHVAAARRYGPRRGGPDG